jgi:hypothetical protein
MKLFWRRIKSWKPHFRVRIQGIFVHCEWVLILWKSSGIITARIHMLAVHYNGPSLLTDCAVYDKEVEEFSLPAPFT